MGLRLRWWCWWWKLRRKLAIPTHKHPTQFVFCAVGVVFVLGWGLFWRLFELKSLFLDFGRMEKMVGLSSNRWWYEDGGIVYQKKKKKDDGFKLWSVVVWRWWYSLPKKKKDGGFELRSVVVWRWWYSLPKKKRRWWYEDRGVIWFPLMKRAIASSIKRCAVVKLLWPRVPCMCV